MANVQHNEDESRTCMRIHVECYSGYRGEEAPRRFHLGERTVAAVEVIDRWLAPDHSYFKVRGDDGGVYILRYDTMSDHWEMTMFDSGRRPDPTPESGRSRERSIT